MGSKGGRKISRYAGVSSAFTSSWAKAFFLAAHFQAGLCFLHVYFEPYSGLDQKGYIILEGLSISVIEEISRSWLCMRNLKLILIILNTETKELKRRIRDIIEPGRDLGHVDGKKKSIVGAYTTALEHRSQGLNQNEDPIEADPQKKETDGEEEVRLPHAISNIEVHGHESERKYTPMDLNNIEMRDERRETDVKRNPDGSICEDCN